MFLNEQIEWGWIMIVTHWIRRERYVLMHVFAEAATKDRVEMNLRTSNNSTSAMALTDLSGTVRVSKSVLPLFYKFIAQLETIVT